MLKPAIGSCGIAAGHNRRLQICGIAMESAYVFASGAAANHPRSSKNRAAQNVINYKLAYELRDTAVPRVELRTHFAAHIFQRPRDVA